MKNIFICVIIAGAVIFAVFISRYYKRHETYLNKAKENVEQCSALSNSIKGACELVNLKGGYLIKSLAENERNFIDIKLEYIGSAKVDAEESRTFNDLRMRGLPSFDGNTLYACEGYFLFSDERGFEIYKNEFKLYDFDFAIDYESGKSYVMSIGRELKWLQFNPDWVSMYGTVANRVGFDWNAEVVPNTVYVYGFSYDIKKYGSLGEMTIEFSKW